MGVDAFFEIHTWKSYRQLFDLADFIVMTRPDQQASTPGPPFESAVLAYAQRHICTRYAMPQTVGVLEHPEKKSIFMASVPPVAIASTQIRDMIRTGQSIHHLACPGVADYIEHKGLYR